MEEFQTFLRQNKSKPALDQHGNPLPGKFELHKVDRDSTGRERYIKTSEDDALFRAKLS
jgi:tetratricopeptide (TPR) repeat protein